MVLKQNFVNACNTMDGAEFIAESLLYLREVYAKDELNDFVNMFGRISKIKHIEKSSVLDELCMLLRNKVYDILIANGEVPENNYMYLYNYYSLCELDPDPRYEAYEQFVDQNLYGADVSDMEKMFLVVLRFFAAMANSKKDAFEKFLSSAMRLNLIEVGSVSFSELVSHFIDDSDVAFEEVLGVVEKLLDKEFYFSLDKDQRRSIFNWSLHSLWLVERYFNHPSWVSLYPKWKAIFYEHIARNECDEAMYVQFFIYHKMGNNFQTQEEWRRFNDEIDIPASQYYKRWQEAAKLPTCKSEQNNGKKIIGFLQDRFAMNSPFKIQYSLWKALYQNEEFRSRYEIKVYLMSYFEKSLNDGECLNMVENLGIEVFDGAVPFYNDGIYHSHLRKALHIREKIISDGVDILISPNNGYDISDFLISGRVAQRQVYWSHGNAVYGIDGIDKKITHLLYKNERDMFDHFEMTISSMFRNYEHAKEKAKKIKDSLPADKLILGTIGRLVKLDNEEYLDTIQRIMEKHPNTIYIACGGGNIENLKEKLDRRGLSERFIFPGYIDAHVYGYVIDLWLDTFPMHQGESMAEYSSKGGVFLRLLDRKEDADFMVSACGLSDLCRDWAVDSYDYEKVAGYLIENRQCTEKLSHINLHNGSVVADDMIKSGLATFLKIISE